MAFSTRRIGAVALLVAAAACAPARHGRAPDRPTAPLAGSAVFVFLRTTTAPSIAFDGSQAHAIRADGGAGPSLTAAPLPEGRPSPPERLWLSGAVPPGSYAGLRLSFSSASKTTPGGESPLAVPDAPVDVAFPFTVTAERSVVLTAELRSETTG